MDARVNIERVFDLSEWSGAHLARVERALERWVSLSDNAAIDHAAPASLLDAMRYAVLDGGKRLRPLLVLAAAEAARSAQASLLPAGQGEPSQAALRAACAVELIHAYSLVHDDMPCMDNDVMHQ